MLDVSLNPIAVAAMLLCIVAQSLGIELDSLNSPTAKPILSGRSKVGIN